MTRIHPALPGRLTSLCYALPLAAAALALPQHAMASTACFASWNSSTAYTGGQTASLNGENYTANWWTQNQSPSTNSGGSGSGQPWTLNGACGSGGTTPTPTPTPTPSPTPPGSTSCFTPWNSSTAYNGGQTASLNGENYTAAWWTQNQSPASNSGATGSGQPWVLDGSCSGSATPPPTPTPTPSPTPPGATTRLYAPYIDLGMTASENLVAMQQQGGFKAVTLAFLDATSGCAVGWGSLGGSLPSDTFSNGDTVLHVVQQLQSAGVQVIISFGGANGQDPAGNCSSASQLQALYQSVITRYGVKLLDFDIEGGATTNQAAITQRDQALKALKAANAGLVISYTLPVLPTGLVSSGINILNSVKNDGLALDVVNVMAMDYGSSSDNGGAMGLDATDAASATWSQINAAGLSGTTVGITPMIGVNDTNTEIFQLNDAQAVLNFANSNSYISRLAIWSLGRDNGGCPGQTWASPSCSGIAQSSYQFTSNFNTY